MATTSSNQPSLERTEHGAGISAARKTMEQGWESFVPKTLYAKLPLDSQRLIRRLFFDFRLTFQELRQVIVAERDLRMWDEPSLWDWWHGLEEPPSCKEVLLSEFFDLYETTKLGPKKYAATPRDRSRGTEAVLEIRSSSKSVYGLCPVASDETMCCLLRTIDAVERCAFGCTYCTIQTFYGDRFSLDGDFGEKLRSIKIDPERFYHFGSGQSSDSLLWGNSNNILGELMDFAAKHPNILLELKTKSGNIDYLLQRSLPKNVVCGWSLNTETVIRNEEWLTPDLSTRLEAARRIADTGVKVAFHFHPMIYYEGWEDEYEQVGRTLMERFHPAEVLFVSIGSLTLIKPVIKAIRAQDEKTKILQMPTALDPKGKVTYPDEIKLRLFRHLLDVLSPWKGKVFFYLCMEKASIWRQLFGYVYASNEEFEREFGKNTLNRIVMGPGD